MGRTVGPVWRWNEAGFELIYFQKNNCCNCPLVCGTLLLVAAKANRNPSASDNGDGNKKLLQSLSKNDKIYSCHDKIKQ